MYAALLTAALGAYQAIQGSREKKKAEKELEKTISSMPEYKESPYARMALAQAQAQNNSTNPAIAQLYNRQQQLAANVASSGQNYASSGGEAIQAAISGQQLANQTQPQIAAMQNQYDMQNRASLQNALATNTNEYQNQYQSQVAKNDAFQNLRAGQLKNATSKYQGGLGNLVSGAGAASYGIGNRTSASTYPVEASSPWQNTGWGDYYQ